MYWTGKSKPAPGTRYLVSRGEKRLVLVMGYETGPVDAAYLLGLQSEVAYYLGVKNYDSVEVGHLVDQSAPPGPASCRHAVKLTPLLLNRIATLSLSRALRNYPVVAALN
jgi:hypothetical protein